MNITKLAGFVAATAVTFGIGAVNVATASATDNIKPFGESEGLNGPNSLPYITYTVKNLAPSSDPVPHNGRLYAARLVVDGNYPPQIERFGARTESGLFYPAIPGYSNLGKLYFDVVGPIPNSVVWNDGIRDILAWIPGDPVSESNAAEPPVFPEEGFSAAAPPAGAPAAAPTMPAENDTAIVATPNDLASPPFSLTEADVASPGFNAGGGGGGHR